VQKEPADAIDPEITGSLATIGIVKGKPFKPDERRLEVEVELPVSSCFSCETDARHKKVTGNPVFQQVLDLTKSSAARNSHGFSADVCCRHPQGN
jgi:hypothetical protein